MVGPSRKSDERKNPWLAPKVWLALISLGFVLYLFSWEEARTVPTPISAVHAQERELLTSNDCARCHGTAEQTLAEACYDCHGSIEEQLRSATGFHGAALKGEATHCGSCHIEHAGREFPLVAEHSFVRAGFASRDDFDHPFDDYDLDGAHDDLECSECHANADLEVLPVGQRRFQGLDRACASCHDDSPHEGRMQRDCVVCHGQERPFVEVATFEHDERFPLSGIHAVDDCKECHAPETSDSIEDLASLDELPEVRGCAACHESLHDEGFLDLVVALASPSPTDRCTLCHLGEHERFVEARESLSDAFHSASGFALEPPHDVQECAECHDPALEWEERFLGRERRGCEACHDDPHRAQFATDTEYRDCQDCHLIDRFVPASFDLDEHAGTEFPLVGHHRGVSCYACHELAADAPPAGDVHDREWNALDSRCSTCHDDAHAGFFEQRALEMGSTAPDDCSDCHEPEGFAAAEDGFTAEHARWTGFELDGAHEALECAACHVPQLAADQFGRRFGNITNAWGAAPTKTRPCIDCHADPHDVDFEAAGRRREVDGRFGCARCHDTQKFANQPFGEFDHEAWTERHLGGRHLELECHDCHVPRVAPDELGRVFGKVREVFGESIDRCVTCHADPHRGLFDGQHAPPRVDGREGCARCHGEVDFARILLEDFDHDLWTNTDFASRHSAQTCDDCHPKLLDPGFAERGRREALGRSCVLCHTDPHAGQFLVDRVNDCRVCHDDQTDWTELRFDHDRDSRYALDDVHEPLECSACHIEYGQLGGPPIVRYKPLGMECIDCHPLDDGGDD